MNTGGFLRTGSILMAIWLGACTTLPERALRTDFSRPHLGVRLRVVSADDLPPHIASATTLLPQQHLQSISTQALLVVRVDAGQSAERAGILVGDYLMALFGNTVSNMRESVSIMQKLTWGDEAQLTVLRDQELLNIQVLLRQ